jgi:hypothetical protein
VNGIVNGIALPLVLAALTTLTATVPVLAGVRPPGELGPDDVPCNLPDRSSVVYSAPSSPCQYRFHATGALDEMSVLVTLRDCFDVPVPACSLDVELIPNAGTLAFCSCEGTLFGAVTDLDGVAEMRFSKIGGRGSLDLVITARCAGSIVLFEETIDFTTPDLNGSCESSPDASTNVIDLGTWANGISPYRVESDFNCDGSVGIVDLGIWASGLGVGCGD